MEPYADVSTVSCDDDSAVLHTSETARDRTRGHAVTRSWLYCERDRE